MSSFNARQILLSCWRPGAMPRVLSDNQRETSDTDRLCDAAKNFLVASLPCSMHRVNRLINARSLAVRTSGATGPLHRGLRGFACLLGRLSDSPHSIRAMQFAASVWTLASAATKRRMAPSADVVERVIASPPYRARNRLARPPRAILPAAPVRSPIGLDTHQHATRHPRDVCPHEKQIRRGMRRWPTEHCQFGSTEIGRAS